MATLSFNNISKVFVDGFKLIDNLNLEISNSEFIVLVGPSGCGKTTLIRMVAGLESVSSGTISINNRDITAMPPCHRDVSIVFQNHLIYPNMTVYENIYYGLKVLSLSGEEANKRIINATDFLNLGQVLNTKASKLNTYQKQCLNIAKSLAKQPKVLLFDNLLENLEPEIHQKLRDTIKNINNQYKITSIYVTNNQQDAVSFGEKIVILNKGVIEQIGTPNQIYNKPVSIFAASFIGVPPMNILPCSVDNHGNVYDDKQTLLLLDNNQIPEMLYNKSLYIGIRPENVQLHASGIPLIVENIVISGNEQLIYGRHSDTGLIARCSVSEQNKFPIEIGETIQFGTLDNKNWHWFDKNTGLRITI